MITLEDFSLSQVTCQTKDLLTLKTKKAGRVKSKKKSCICSCFQRVSFGQLHLTGQPGSALCVGCTGRNRAGTECSQTSGSASTPRQHSSLHVWLAANSPTTMCEGLSNHRMQYGWENLDQCDLKGPAWQWETMGTVPQALQQAMLAGLRSPSSHHLRCGDCCSSAHSRLTSASQLGAGVHRQMTAGLLNLWRKNTQKTNTSVRK